MRATNQSVCTISDRQSAYILAAHGVLARTYADERSGRLIAMGGQPKQEVFEQLRRVITWEMEAQVRVKRDWHEMPALIADSALDFFDISLKPGADAGLRRSVDLSRS